MPGDQWRNVLQVCNGMRFPCCTHRTHSQTLCTRNRTRRGVRHRGPAPAPLQLLDILNVIQRQDGLLHALLRRTEPLAGRVTLLRLPLHPGKCSRLQHTLIIPLLQRAKKLHHWMRARLCVGNMSTVLQQGSRESVMMKSLLQECCCRLLERGQAAEQARLTRLRCVRVLLGFVQLCVKWRIAAQNSL